MHEYDYISSQRGEKLCDVFFHARGWLSAIQSAALQTDASWKNLRHAHSRPLSPTSPGQRVPDALLIPKRPAYYLDLHVEGYLPGYSRVSLLLQEKDFFICLFLTHSAFFLPLAADFLDGQPL
jgi:hypothetical protein